MKATTLASSLYLPGYIVVDGSNLYWISGGGGVPATINRMPVTGGTPVVVAQGGANTVRLAVDATYVYWTETGLGNGGIYRALK